MLGVRGGGEGLDARGERSHGGQESVPGARAAPYGRLAGAPGVQGSESQQGVWQSTDHRRT